MKPVQDQIYERIANFSLKQAVKLKKFVEWNNLPHFEENLEEFNPALKIFEAYQS